MGGVMTTKRGWTVYQIEHSFFNHYLQHECQDELKDVVAHTSIDNGKISNGEYKPNEGIVKCEPYNQEQEYTNNDEVTLYKDDYYGGRSINLSIGNHKKLDILNLFLAAPSPQSAITPGFGEFAISPTPGELDEIKPSEPQQKIGKTLFWSSSKRSVTQTTFVNDPVKSIIIPIGLQVIFHVVNPDAYQNGKKVANDIIEKVMYQQFCPVLPDHLKDFISVTIERNYRKEYIQKDHKNPFRHEKILKIILNCIQLFMKKRVYNLVQ